ncbi:hypothetical protein DFH06DRAFT_1442200 [Mycena polygramma]|nr:hypothetical protein DFH06DRAFT_1442200 [Mycena polygramma]
MPLHEYTSFVSPLGIPLRTCAKAAVDVSLKIESGKDAGCSLPPELEREIFEIAALCSPNLIPTILLANSPRPPLWRRVAPRHMVPPPRPNTTSPRRRVWSPHRCLPSPHTAAARFSSPFSLIDAMLVAVYSYLHNDVQENGLLPKPGSNSLWCARKRHTTQQADIAMGPLLAFAGCEMFMVSFPRFDIRLKTVVALAF